LISVAMCVCVCVQADGEDELKKMQLMELAIMNGTYRDAVPQHAFLINTPRMYCWEVFYSGIVP